MSDSMVRILGIGLAVGFGTWFVLKVWDLISLIRDYRIDNGHGGLANDGDDWSPFPCVPEPEHKRPDIEQQVCQDILDRQKIGVPKYGGTVAESNEPLRAWLVHSYQEKLDDVIYMKRAIAAIDEQERLDRDK